MNRMLPLLGRRANIEPNSTAKKIFLSSYLFHTTAHACPHDTHTYPQQPRGYPQFKKVFSQFHIEIHTSCAERFTSKYFAGTLEHQNAVFRRIGAQEQGKKRPKHHFTGCRKLGLCLRPPPNRGSRPFRLRLNCSKNQKKTPGWLPGHVSRYKIYCFAASVPFPGSRRYCLSFAGVEGLGVSRGLSAGFDC